MDECGEILLLLRACGCVWCAGKNCRDIAIQVRGRELDGMARDRAGIEAGEPAVGIYDSVPSDLHTAAHWFVLTIRDVVPKPRDLATAEFTSIRVRLLKIAARVIETAGRVRLAFAVARPEADFSAASTTR